MTIQQYKPNMISPEFLGSGSGWWDRAWMEVDRSLAMSTRLFHTTCFQPGVFSLTRSSCAGNFNWITSCWGVSGVLLISHHYFSLLAQTKLVLY